MAKKKLICKEAKDRVSVIHHSHVCTKTFTENTAPSASKLWWAGGCLLLMHAQGVLHQKSRDDDRLVPGSTVALTPGILGVQYSLQQKSILFALCTCKSLVNN